MEPEINQRGWVVMALRKTGLVVSSGKVPPRRGSGARVVGDEGVGARTSPR